MRSELFVANYHQKEPMLELVLINTPRLNVHDSQKWINIASANNLSPSYFPNQNVDDFHKIEVVQRIDFLCTNCDNKRLLEEGYDSSFDKRWPVSKYVMSFISDSNGYTSYLHKLSVFVASDNSTALYNNGNHEEHFYEDRGYPV